MKQGDVISPLLFNAGLEAAIRRWKSKLGQQGLRVDTGERLTNIRYADDLMIYARSCSELCDMMEKLMAELAEVGLSPNTDKTKIMTTMPLYVDVADGMVEVLTGSTVHKYLGRHIPGDLKTRGEVEFAHRLAAAWGKFRKHRATLLNKHVSIKLRLKLFEAVVTPTVLFGLSTLPISKAQLAQLDVVQRKMLRSIAGWVRY